MIFVSQLSSHQIGYHRRHTTQLGMTKGILSRAGLTDELAVGKSHALGNHNYAKTFFRHGGFYPAQKLLPIKGYFGQQNNMWRVSRLVTR